MKRNEIIGEIKAIPAYLRAAERSRSQARDAQRTFGKSPEEKAAARRKEINRDKGIAGYSKRHRKENPDMYPEVKPRDDMKGPSGPQDWYGQNRYMGDSVEEGFPKDPNAPKLVQDRKTGKWYDPNKEFEKKMTSPKVMAQMKRMAQKEGVAEVAGAQKCWPGHRKVGTQPGTGKNKGKRVNDCEKISELASPDYIPTLNKAKELLAKGMTVDQVARQLAVQGPNNQLIGPMGGKWGAINAAKQQLSSGKMESVEEALEEGRSDYVGDAIEGLRMYKPGLEKEDFLDELYSYIDAEMGNRAAEAAFADKDSYDDWYDSYADSMEENANMLKVSKDDDKQTILQNPSTGVQTQIDKTNPNAPRLTQDDQGKLKLAATTQGDKTELKPNLVGKDVEVATESAELTAMLRIAGLR
jgi:hypothetical protein